MKTLYQLAQANDYKTFDAILQEELGMSAYKNLQAILMRSGLGVVDEMLSIIAGHYSVSVDEMKSPSRTMYVAEARNVAMYILRKKTILSQVDIGKIFNCNHSTVSCAYSTIESRIKTGQLLVDFDSLCSEI